MEETEERINIPWPEDEILFCEGNWSIYRGSCVGMYSYVVDGIAAREEVDGFQLIEWGMAKLHSYTALQPWKNSGITVNYGEDVLRDFAGDEKIADRWYFVHVKGRIYRVNKYYLIANGLATPSDKLVQKIRESGSSRKKADDISSPWPGDSIEFKTVKDVTIKRAPAEGRYRVNKSGLTLTWDAARLVAEGLAEDVYDKKLKKLVKSESFSIKDLRERFGNFWMSPEAEKISTFHDIAVLWGKLENPSAEEVKRILEYNRLVLTLCDKAIMDLSGGSSDDEWKDAYKKAKDCEGKMESSAAEALACKIAPLESIFRKVDKAKKFAAAEVAFNGFAAELEKHKKDLLDLVAGMGSATVTVDVPKPFPVNLLPEESAAKGERTYKKIIDLRDKIASVPRSAASTTELRTRAQMIDINVPKYRTAIEALKPSFNGVLERDKVLKDAQAAIFAQKGFKKKKPMMRHPKKSDRIEYTTNTDVQPASVRGRYIVFYTSPEKYTTFIEVSVEELVYMGLAKYV